MELPVFPTSDKPGDLTELKEWIRYRKSQLNPEITDEQPTIKTDEPVSYTDLRTHINTRRKRLRKESKMKMDTHYNRTVFQTRSLVGNYHEEDTLSSRGYMPPKLESPMNIEEQERVTGQ